MPTAVYGPAYGSLAYIRTLEGDHAQALEYFDRARSLGFDDSWGRAILLMKLARFDAAVAEYRKAIASDPLSKPVKAQFVQASFCAGRYDSALAEIAAALRADPTLTLSVVGHTDNQGDYGYNRALSERRALAVVAALGADATIAADRLLPVGVGPVSPVASNESDEGRALNRRVELVER